MISLVNRASSFSSRSGAVSCMIVRTTSTKTPLMKKNWLEGAARRKLRACQVILGRFSIELSSKRTFNLRTTTKRTDLKLK